MPVPRVAKVDWTIAVFHMNVPRLVAISSPADILRSSSTDSAFTVYVFACIHPQASVKSVVRPVDDATWLERIGRM